MTTFLRLIGFAAIGYQIQWTVWLIYNFVDTLYWMDFEDTIVYGILFAITAVGDYCAARLAFIKKKDAVKQ